MTLLAVTADGVWTLRLQYPVALWAWQEGDTALLLAAAAAHIPMIEFLVSKGAKVDYARPVRPSA